VVEAAVTNAAVAHVSYTSRSLETRGRWPSPPRRRRHRFGRPFGRVRTAARARIWSGQAPGFFRDSSEAGPRVCGGGGGVVAVAKVRTHIHPPTHLRATASHHLVHRRSRRRRRHSHRRRRRRLKSSDVDAWSCCNITRGRRRRRRRR